jgi:signal transduction histidine kinase
LAFLATVQQFAEIVFEKIRPYEQIKADYEQTKSQLQKMAEQAAFANLTMGIAHEIRNPFGILQTSINILVKKRDDDQMVKTMSGRIESAIQRILKIMDHMTAYGRVDHSEARSENVKQIIEDYLFTAKPHYAADGIILNDLLSEVPLIKANASAIYQMVGNVVQNAAEAIQDTGQPGSITVGLAPQERKLDGHHVPGVVITITDTGPGMSSDTQEKLFNAFFSTKHTHTGLGMSIVLNLAKAHGGFVDVESKEGSGTTIRLWFPTASG